MIDFECIISLSLVTDHVGFNRIKYEYSLCHWLAVWLWNEIGICALHDERVVMTKQLYPILFPQCMSLHNFIVFMYLVYFSFTFRNRTILAVSQCVGIEIGRRVVWYTANDTPGNPGIAHPKPQLTSHVNKKYRLKNHFRKESVKHQNHLGSCLYLDGWRIPIAIYLALAGVSQEEVVYLFEFKQASFEMTSIETWSNQLLCYCWLSPSVSPQPIKNFSSCSCYTRIKVQSDRGRSCLSRQPLYNHFFMP